MKQPSVHHRARLLSVQILFVVTLWSLPGCPIFAQALPPGSPEYGVANDIIKLRAKVLKNPDDLKSLFQLGRKYEQRKEWGEAIKTYETVIRKKTDYGDAWLWLGWSYFRANNDEEALKVFDELTAITSHAPDAYAGTGWVYYKQGLYSKALASYKQAIQARPNFAGAIYDLGRTHIAMNNREAARAQQTALAGIDPTLANLLQREIDRAEKKASGAAAASNAASKSVALDDAFSRKPYALYYEKIKLPPSIKSCAMNGEVRLNVLINPDGSAGDIKPISELPFGLTEIAIEAVQKSQLDPVVEMGKPIPSRLIFTYIFWLD